MSKLSSKPLAPKLPPLLARCLAAAAATGSTLLRHRAPKSWERGLVDLAIALRVDGHRADFVVAIRTTLGADAAIALQPMQRTVEANGARLLVCTRRATRTQCEQFRASGISLLDTTGTVSLQAKGLRVHCLGRAPAATAEPKRTTSTDTLVLHTLMRRGAGPCTHRQLAQEAGVSLGAVGTALRALEARGLLRRRGEDLWAVSDDTAAQARFAEGWTTMVRRKLAPQHYRAAEAHWVVNAPTRIARLAPHVLLGGELAAIRLGASLSSEAVTLHVAAEHRTNVVRQLRLLPDAQGPITILDRLGDGDSFPDPADPTLLLAHPLLVHAELATHGDERLADAMTAVWEAWRAARGAR